MPPEAREIGRIAVSMETEDALEYDMHVAYFVTVQRLRCGAARRHRTVVDHRYVRVGMVLFFSGFSHYSSHKAGVTAATRQLPRRSALMVHDGRRSPAALPPSSAKTAVSKVRADHSERAHPRRRK